MHTGRARSEPTSALVANSLGLIKTTGIKRFFKVLKIHTLVFCVVTTCRLLSLPKLLKRCEQFLVLASVYRKLFIKFNFDSFSSNISRTLREAQTDFSKCFKTRSSCKNFVESIRNISEYSECVMKHKEKIFSDFAVWAYNLFHVGLIDLYR